MITYIGIYFSIIAAFITMLGLLWAYNKVMDWVDEKRLQRHGKLRVKRNKLWVN